MCGSPANSRILSASGQRYGRLAFFEVPPDHESRDHILYISIYIYTIADMCISQAA